MEPTQLVPTVNEAVSPGDPPSPVMDRLLTMREVEVLTSLSKQMIYRKIAQGVFPKPMVISEDRHGRATRVAWSALELKAWRESKPKRVGGPCIISAEVRAA
jgi:predicted DNA-binding transcriptional regulator AlpA